MYKVIIINEEENSQSEYKLSKNSKMTIKVKKGNLSTNVDLQTTKISQQVIKGDGNIISATGNVYCNQFSK